jgi:GWxTD domain-containing protein
MPEAPRSCCRTLGPRVAALLAAAFTCATAAGAAPSPEAGLDKAAETWLRKVHLLILPEEEAFFRSLKQAEDRKEFERIFWARRTSGAASQNDFQAVFTRAQARADELFTLPGTRGSETGCGQVFTLLGDPLEVEGASPGQVQGRGARQQFNSLEPMREGTRRPETWVYRSRAGDALSFTGGELRVALDESCRFSEAGRVLDDLRRAAQVRVLRPEIAYRLGSDGRLVRLEEVLRGTGSGALALLASPREDFPLEIEPKLLLRTQAGRAYAAGLFRLQVTEGAGGPVVGTVAAEAVGASGPSPAASDRTFSTTVGAGGAILGSYGVSLAPGAYTLRVAVRLADGRGAVATRPLEVPNFETPGLKAAGLVLYPDEPSPAADPRDPFAALTVGALRLRSRFGNAFSARDALQVVSVLYGGKVDAASGKAALRARFTILKDGKAVAKGEDQVFDTPMAVASIGPVSLSGFTPGRYQVKLDGSDTLAGSATSQEESFEITP